MRLKVSAVSTQLANRNVVSPKLGKRDAVRLELEKHHSLSDKLTWPHCHHLLKVEDE